MDSAFGNWLAGFYCGEGSFCCYLNGRGLILQATLGCRADEYPILAECQRQTGIGGLYYRPFDGPGTGNSRPQYVWTVQSKKDREQLVALFTKYPLRGKKSNDFKIWAAIHREHVAHGIQNIAKIQTLSEELKFVRKYDAQYEQNLEV